MGGGFLINYPLRVGGGGGGQVNTVVPGTNIAVDATDPANPIVSTTFGYTPENVANKVSAFQVTPDNTHYPTEKLVKDYVDLSILALGLTEYYRNVASTDIATYYQLATASGTDSLTSAAINTTANDQLVFSFATEAGLPGLIELIAGNYLTHVHLFKTGNRNVTMYCTLSKRAVGGAETLIGTSSTTMALTTVQMPFDIALILSSKVDLLVTDRLVVKWYANVGNGASTTISFGGQNDSDFSIKRSPAAINAKADKIIPAVVGNIAGLDATGNLTDTGVQPTAAGVGAIPMVAATYDGDSLMAQGGSWQAGRTPWGLSIDVTPGPYQTHSHDEGKLLQVTSTLVTDSVFIGDSINTGKFLYAIAMNASGFTLDAVNAGKKINGLDTLVIPFSTWIQIIQDSNGDCWILDSTDESLIYHHGTFTGTVGIKSSVARPTPVAGQVLFYYLDDGASDYEVGIMSPDGVPKIINSWPR